MQAKKNKNVIAVGIGLLLVIVIAVFTFFRPQIFHGPPTDDPAQSIVNSKNSTSPSYLLTSAQLLDKTRSDNNLVIIDTRSADEFKQEHILDSKNIPADSLDAKLPVLDKNKDYVIVDDGSGSGLPLVTDSLPSEGIRNVFYLNGGWMDWKNNNEPTVAAGDPTSFADQSKVNYIKSDDLKNILTAESDLAIIDLRSSDNYDKGHIPGAINIFIDDLESKRSQIPVGKKIILYDKDGLWAFQGSVRLFDMGVFNVFCLADGLDAWQQKNYPLTK